MNFEYSDEQRLLQDSVARFVREHCAFDARRRLVDAEPGWSADHWRLFAELGWLAIPVAEAHGGLGGGAVDAAILFEQFGLGLVVEPYLATLILGAGTVATLGNAAQREALLGGAVAGELQLALAYAEPQARYAIDDIATLATPSGAGWTLAGHKCAVLNAPAADITLVSARTPAGAAAVFAVDRGAPCTTVHSYRTLDGGRAADIVFTGSPATRLGDGEVDAVAALGSVLDRAALCVCAEAVGAMSALLDKTVAYTRVRKQFGVAIASFQALQHRMAEMFIELEQSRSILLMALLIADGGEGEQPRAVSAAKSRIGRAARRVGEEAVQLHGGIGVTDELDVGHYLKRLLVIETLFGNSDWHLQRFGRLSQVSAESRA